MKQVNLYEAKTHLSRLVDEAAGGAEIVIAKDGKPLAALVPLARVSAKPPRALGLWKGEVVLPPDWEVQSEEADKEIQRLMEDGDIFPAPGTP